MRKLTLVAGSTNELAFFPEAGLEPQTVEVELYDGSGAEVALGDPAIDDDGVWRVTVPHDDVPASSVGEVWSGAFVVTIFDGTYTQVRRKPFLAEVVADAPALTLSVGEDSYVTLDEADAYMEAKVGAQAWDAANLVQRTAALLAACRRIDALRLAGRKHDPDQALAFPRVFWSSGATALSEEDERWSAHLAGAGYVGDGTVPEAVKAAQCEEALAILTGATDHDRRALRAQGVTSVRIGEFSETYDRYGTERSGALSSPEAAALLAPFMAGAAVIA